MPMRVSPSNNDMPASGCLTVLLIVLLLVCVWMFK